jgi:hypothetical protein
MSNEMTETTSGLLVTTSVVSFISFVLCSLFYIGIFSRDARTYSIEEDVRKSLEIEQQTKNNRMMFLFGTLLSLALFFFSSFRLANMEDNYIANVAILWMFFLSVFSLFAEGPKMYKYMAPL